jgi:hypothetical protein
MPNRVDNRGGCFVVLGSAPVELKGTKFQTVSMTGRAVAFALIIIASAIIITIIQYNNGQRQVVRFVDGAKEMIQAIVGSKVK